MGENQDKMTCLLIQFAIAESTFQDLAPDSGTQKPTWRSRTGLCGQSITEGGPSSLLGLQVTLT